MSVTCRIGLLILAAIPLILGCDEDEIAWLPDSSGVIYRDETQGYSRYDLQKKESEQILKPTEDNDLQGVAISPKGDQFALVQITHEEESRLEILIHSMSGEVVSRSGKYKFPKRDSGMDYESTDIAMEWSTGNRIVLYRSGKLLGFYDPATSKLIYIKGYGRYTEGSYVGSDLLPDGSGVLAAKLPPETEENPPPFPDAAVIDWQGRVRVIKVPAMPAALNSLVNQTEPACLALHADWKNNAFRYQVQDYRLDIDPRAGTARWYSLPVSLEKQVPARDKQAEYQAIPVGAAGVYVYAKTIDKDSNIETINVKTRGHKVLAEKVQPEGAVRSPDGSKIAITVTEKFPDKKMAQRKVLIIDQTGALIGTLNRGEFPYEDPPALDAAPAAGDAAPAAPAAPEPAPK